MEIKENSVVSLHYTVKTDDGTEIDSSFDGEPMQIIQGSHYLIEGLERALTGRVAGEKFSVDVEPEEAYGERQDVLVQSVPKSLFEDVDVEIGMSFRATTDEGEQSVIVIEVNDDEIVVDGNHPLAGLALSFDVEVLSVREATIEELDHGHVHSHHHHSHGSDAQSDNCCGSEANTSCCSNDNDTGKGGCCH